MHQINLHGPWQILKSDNPAAKTDRCPFPCFIRDSGTWLQGFSLQRKFHLPTGITTSQAVLLHLQFEELPQAISLNGEQLEEWGTESPDDVTWQIEVTSRLLPFNTLSLHFVAREKYSELPIFQASKLIISGE